MFDLWVERDNELEGGAVVDDLARNVILSLISGKQDGRTRVFNDIGDLILAARGIDGDRL